MTEPLDPEVAAVVEAALASGAPGSHELPVEEARAASRASSFALGGAGEQVARVEDREIGGVPSRVYWPADHDGALVGWFHGGGWVVGDLDGWGPVCRALANASGCAIACVDYRLAPEHPHPAPLEDTLAATRALIDDAAALGCDPERVAVGGDSAGGNLATVAARKVGGLRFQCLVYPVCDAGQDTASYAEFAGGPMLGAEAMAWYWGHYLGGTDPLDPDVSPLRATDLGGSPPALIITASHDPLRDEAEDYARALETAGVEVTVSRHAGTVHGFFRWLAVAGAARRAVHEAGAALRHGTA